MCSIPIRVWGVQVFYRARGSSRTWPGFEPATLDLRYMNRFWIVHFRTALTELPSSSYNDPYVMLHFERSYINCIKIVTGIICNLFFASYISGIRTRVT